jgi:quercetin dioxygenase-like cupin family protein
VEVPKQGILSSALHNDDQVKVVLFGFSTGQELSAHTTPFPVDLFFLRGEGTLTLGPDRKNVAPGLFAHIKREPDHDSIVAVTPLVMLLVMM